MTPDRIEELAKMAYEAGHHPTSADFADIGPAAKENLRIIVRTLYAAIMTEAEGVAIEAARVARALAPPGKDDIAFGKALAAERIADALHARAKDMNDDTR